MSNEKEISDQDYKRAKLLAYQAISSHLCAVALGSKQRNPNYGKPLSGRLGPLQVTGNPTEDQLDKEMYLPLSEQGANWHMGTQHQVNTVIDALVGNDAQEAATVPRAVPEPDDAPDNVVDLKGKDDDA